MDAKSFHSLPEYGGLLSGRGHFAHICLKERLCNYWSTQVYKMVSGARAGRTVHDLEGPWFIPGELTIFRCSTFSAQPAVSEGVVFTDAADASSSCQLGALS